VQQKVEGMGVIVKRKVFIIGTALVVGLGAIFGTMLIKTIQYTIEESAAKDLEKSQDLSYKEINQILQNKASSNQKTELDQEINKTNKTSAETSDLADTNVGKSILEDSSTENFILEPDKNIIPRIRRKKHRRWILCQRRRIKCFGMGRTKCGSDFFSQVGFKYKKSFHFY